MYEGLKAYIERLEREGELVRIAARVDPVLEIAEITDRISKTPGGGKALLFENTGTEFPVLVNAMGSDRRMALALGAERLEELTERIEELLKRLTRPADGWMDKLRMLPLLAEMSRWLPRNRSGRGACQEVVWSGDEADLGRIPVLKCWGCDGGRFVTLPMVHTLDPETGMRNVGMYRMQIFDGRTTGMHWHRHKTGARHYDGYKRAGRRMPVTVTLGGDPVYTYAATAPMPDNMDEYLLAGFLRRRPVELVESLTNGIRIPADCDFVIEGYVDPSEEPAVEGPFGDHTGFYSLEDRYPRFHVTSVSHRRGAVWPATLVGVPPEEDAYIARATERIFLAPIRLAVQPEVRDLWMPTPGTAHNLAVVSLDTRYAGQAVKVAQGLWGAGQMMFNKYMLATDAAVDIRNLDALADLLRRIDPGCWTCSTMRPPRRASAARRCWTRRGSTPRHPSSRSACLAASSRRAASRWWISRWSGGGAVWCSMPTGSGPMRWTCPPIWSGTAFAACGSCCCSTTLWRVPCAARICCGWRRPTPIRAATSAYGRGRF